MWRPYLAALSWQTRISWTQYLQISSEIPNDPPKDWGRVVRESKISQWLMGNPRWLDEAMESLGRLEGLGAKLIYPGHEDYPESFLHLKDPPLALSYLGRPNWDGLLLSVVGSRDASPYSYEWMDEHLPSFVRHGVVLASGGARGIDQKAHALSLRGGKPTLVFLPSGLASVYPQDLAGWFPAILSAGGAVMSELDPLQPMHRSAFERRNRLIAGISPVLLVVEARRRSGTLITAHHAAEMGRSICLIPGHPCDVHWQGSNDFLFDGAFPVRDGRDLWEVMEPHFQARLRSQTDKAINKALPDHTAAQGGSFSDLAK